MGRRATGATRAARDGAEARLGAFDAPWTSISPPAVASVGGEEGRAHRRERTNMGAGGGIQMGHGWVGQDRLMGHDWMGYDSSKGR